jgi:undecaprenyl-diphosphatase
VLWTLLVVALLLVAAGVAVLRLGWNPVLMLQAHAQAPQPWEVAFWSCATVLGLGWSALILVLASDRGRGTVTALLPASFILGGLLTHVPKVLLAEPRPAATAIYPQLHIIGDAFRGPVSMPSGHALTAAATLVLLWLALPRGRALLFKAALVAVAALVAWSRVVVGAHWPADVFVGAGLGLLAAVLAQAIAAARPVRAGFDGFVRRLRSRPGQCWIAVIEVAGAVGLLHERTGYPAARPMLLLLATVALASAGWRCWGTRTQRAGAQSGPTPAGPT